MQKKQLPPAPKPTTTTQVKKYQLQNPENKKTSTAFYAPAEQISLFLQQAANAFSYQKTSSKKARSPEYDLLIKSKMRNWKQKFSGECNNLHYKLYILILNCLTNIAETGSEHLDTL